jgi:YesN/AraC family two-component response regulator
MPDHERILIKFKENFIATENNSIRVVLNRLFAQDKYLLRPASNDRSVIESSLFNMLNETRTKQQGYEVMLQSLLMKLLVYANRAMDTNWVEHYEHPGHMNRKVSDIIKYINEHYAEPVTLTGISERFLISRYHLSRVFKESIGFTFIEYLNDVRIKEAQRLLRETNHKVINIAETVGFESVAHFGRVFKSVSGSSPLTYRKNYLH